MSLPMSENRRGALRVLLLLALTLAALCATASSAAAAGPAWRVDSMSDTTAAPGSTFEYFITLKNVGQGETSGTVKAVITLPAGITATALSLSNNERFSCSGVPGTVITCESQPGQSLGHEQNEVFHLTTEILPTASGVLTTLISVTGGEAPPLATGDPTQITATPPAFGIDAFDGSVSADALGTPFTQAGGHPYSATTAFDLNTIKNADPFKGVGWPVEPLKDVHVELPPGLVGNPTVVGQCTAAQVAHNESPIVVKEECPPSSQVGVTLIRLNFLGTFQYIGPAPVFNLVPPPGVPARFGFNVAGTVVTLDAHLRSDGDYGLTVNGSDISEGLPVAGSSFTFWGVPADPVHFFERACPGQLAPVDGGPNCEAGVTPRAFLRNPTACTPPGVGLSTTLRVDSWDHPSEPPPAASFTSHLPPGYSLPPSMWGAAQGPTGCEKVPFDPAFDAQPASPAQAGTPSGFTFDLTIPQNDDPSTIGEGDLKKAVVTFPAGVHVSPSSASGLDGCTPAQIGFIGGGFPAPNPLHFNLEEPSCPDASKLGSVTITTPLLEKPLEGSIYLASPNDNPFNSLIAVYLVVHGPGILVKIPGQVSADPVTGQLTSTFDNQPQTPVSKIHLEFKSGPRSPLVTPSACGTYTTQAQLTSWSGRTVESDSQFMLSSDSSGQPCTPLGFNPAFNAGTSNPVAGANSPFTLALTRSDHDQQINTLTVDPPPGLIGSIANTTLCAEAQAQAGTCGEASRIGSVTVGSGAGGSPFYINSGRAYITGPYKGAPFGLSIVVPAVAGPFNLGNVVVRSAIYINPTTAQLHVVSDPFPQILQGIPLDVRDIRVNVDRPGFMFNPTSCERMAVAASVSSTQGASAAVASPFQVAGCSSLAFKPVFSASTSGSTSKANGASLRVHVAARQGPTANGGGEANIRKVEVQLPPVLPSRLTTLQKACTAGQFASDPAGCPPGSFVGTVIAHTPILKSPLSGPAILVSHGGAAFPDLVILLQGEGVRIDLTGHTQIKKGITFSRFETVPDAPVQSFDLTLPQGPHSVLAAFGNLCANTRTLTVRKRITRRIHGHVRHLTRTVKRQVAAPLSMPTTITAQNGAVLRQTTRIAVSGCAKATVKKRATHRRHAPGRRGGR
jgi:hypothetical protein